MARRSYMRCAKQSSFALRRQLLYTTYRGERARSAGGLGGSHPRVVLWSHPLVYAVAGSHTGLLRARARGQHYHCTACPACGHWLTVNRVLSQSPQSHLAGHAPLYYCYIYSTECTVADGNLNFLTVPGTAIF